MTRPGEIGVIDLMMPIPSVEVGSEFGQCDPVALVIAGMDACGIERSMIGIREENERILLALKEHSDRFFASIDVNPNNGMAEVRRIERMHRDFGVKAVTGFPCGLCPQIPIDDKKWYPIYAKCVELDIPVCLRTGVPDSRVPMSPQKVERIDEVCWFFPDLKFVMRHGAEPWTDLAVKLMLKWPNLYYSTCGIAPLEYPADIVHFANTRGSDKILYAGNYPMALFRDLPNVPFRDHVWPKFLRENAVRVFKLEAQPEAGSGM